MRNLNDDALAEWARSLSADSRWREAAAAFELLAERADRRGAVEVSRHAYASAGDALRRDDRPAAAARVLKAALDRTDPRAPELRARRLAALCQLSGVMIEAGQVQAAADLSERALDLAVSPPQRALALDCLVGARFALGDVPGARDAVERLAGVAPPGAAIAVDFRNAQLLRLSGKLDDAITLLAGVLATTSGNPALTGPSAAAHQDLGEIALLADDGLGAAEHFDTAGRLWTAAGRRAGLYRAEAGLVRASLARGVVALGTNLGEPIAFARDRGMPLLEADLLLARGVARVAARVMGADDDLDRAVDLAVASGTMLLEGWARALRRKVGILKLDLARTRECLCHDAVWLKWLDEQAPGR